MKKKFFLAHITPQEGQKGNFHENNKRHHHLLLVSWEALPYATFFRAIQALYEPYTYGPIRQK